MNYTCLKGYRQWLIMMRKLFRAYVQQNTQKNAVNTRALNVANKRLERKATHPKRFKTWSVAILFSRLGEEILYNASCMLIATVNLLLVYCMANLS